MNEQKIIRKNLIKNMFINFITFTLVFFVFDLIIYNQISVSLYKSIDSELNVAKEQYSRQYKKRLSNTKTSEEEKTQENVEIDISNNASSNRQIVPILQKLNPRLIAIFRNEDADIINQNSIGRFYDEYINYITFNKNYTDEVYNININNEYNYRGINFKITDENGKVIYIQLLANVDGETQTVKNISNTLLIGTIIIVMLSIIASYILSKRTIKPIIESWNKQTEFVQNASHELRTPLTIIQAKQELLLQEPNKKIIDKSEDINLSLKETRRLSKLIKELMVLARSDSNKYELNKETTNIDEMIKEVVVPYIDFAATQEKSINLDLKYGKQINIDKSKISQLLIIILDNAIKYTSEKEKIDVKTYLKDGKFILEIADTGIGISDEGLKHIFDRFYREDKAHCRETGGTGLGLSIAQTIVNAHGGTIKIMNNQPKGTKVIIKL